MSACYRGKGPKIKTKLSERLSLSCWVHMLTVQQIEKWRFYQRTSQTAVKRSNFPTCFHLSQMQRRTNVDLFSSQTGTARDIQAVCPGGLRAFQTYLYNLLTIQIEQVDSLKSNLNLKTDGILPAVWTTRLSHQFFKQPYETTSARVFPVLQNIVQNAKMWSWILSCQVTMATIPHLLSLSDSASRPAWRFLPSTCESSIL